MKSIIVFFQKISVTKGVLLALTPLITILFNMKDMLIALLFFILIDMVTGIRKSLKQSDTSVNIFKSNFWRHIHSSGFRKTFRKTLEYIAGVIMFSVVDSFVIKDFSYSLFEHTYNLTESVVVFMCLIEIYSVYENLEAVSGNNIFKRIISMIPELKQFFKKPK